MAKITRNTGNKALGAIGAALTGAAEGAKVGVDLSTKLQNAETQRGFLETQRKKLEQDQKQAQFKQKLFGMNMLNTLMGQGMLTDQPDVFVNNKANEFNMAIEASGSKITGEALRGIMKIKGEKHRGNVMDMLSAKKALFGFDPVNGTPEQLASIMERGSKAFGAVSSVPELPGEAQKEFTAQHKMFIEQGEKLQLELGKVQADASKPTEPTRTFTEAELKEFAKTAAPRIESGLSRVSNIDQAYSLLNNVITSKLAGNKFSATGRELFGDKDFELLKGLLNREGVAVIVEQAEKAGARSVDSDAEAARLISTTGGVDKMAATNIALLLTSKAMQQRTVEELKAKQAHARKHDSFENYQSPLLNKATFANEKTGEIKFIDMENEKIPKGFERLNDLVAKNIKGAPAPTKTDDPAKSGRGAAGRFRP